jgi:hypothetical protein
MSYRSTKTYEVLGMKDTPIYQNQNKLIQILKVQSEVVIEEGQKKK